jgi:lysyl-tRNA synthetase class 1
MQWLNAVLEEAERRRPEGEIIVESGISPSGSYHMGYLREIIICDAIVAALNQRGHQARHIHFVDDQDGFRKVPAGLNEEYAEYLGRPLFDIPAPDGSGSSYAEFALEPFLDSVASLGIKMDTIRSHQRYALGFFVPAIELVLGHIKDVRQVLEEVSGRRLGDEWSPIQVNEEGYLKKRPFLSLDTAGKTISYLDKDARERTITYNDGQVKLDWRLDWPARWWLMKVDVEPFGRDHATRGGSYDTGKVLMQKVFKSPPPIAVPYEFINRAGESKKMSASAGTGILLSEVASVLPPEIIRYFILRYPPTKTLNFDPVGGVARLIDDYAEFLAKNDKTADESQLLMLCTHDIKTTVSSIPFSLLTASYQAALKDPGRTLEAISRTEHAAKVDNQRELILAELGFIDQWLQKWAPEEVKFDLKASIEPASFTPEEKNFLHNLSKKIAQAPADADGDWFHKAIYDMQSQSTLDPGKIFNALYRSLIGKEQGPRAGWFLSILPRDWLIKRLKLEG